MIKHDFRKVVKQVISTETLHFWAVRIIPVCDQILSLRFRESNHWSCVCFNSSKGKTQKQCVTVPKTTVVTIKTRLLHYSCTTTPIDFGDIFYLGPQIRFRLPSGYDVGPKTGGCITNTENPQNFGYDGMETVLPDGGIILCGQRDDPEKCSKLLSGTWTPIADLTYPSQKIGRGGISVTPHGVLLSYGYYKGSTEYYNETTNTWRPGPSLPGGNYNRRKGHCQITMSNMKTWILGQYSLIVFLLSYFYLRR